MTSSIAAGYKVSNGLDSEGYSFTQGVAPGAKVAMCQFFQSPFCNTAPYRTASLAEGSFAGTTEADYYKILRYAFVEMGSKDAVLPDQDTVSPGARIFNHSWNRPSVLYDTPSQLIDQATRTLRAARFEFVKDAPNFGGDVSSLHVISAGNIPDPNLSPPSYVVESPGTAKNAITVGASETYNQIPYANTTCPTLTPIGQPDNLSDNTHQIPSFSRTGFPYNRLKPDLVAPGSRSYGPASSERNPSCPEKPCAENLTNEQPPNPPRFVMYWGTSFAAPVVTGAAALARAWFQSLGISDPSPALVKAALIATAQNLTRQPSCFPFQCNDVVDKTQSCYCRASCCQACGNVRPAPDPYQGWGGVSLDRLFRSSDNYLLVNQTTTLGPPESNSYFMAPLTVTDPNKDVNIALVWTDRASDPKTSNEGLVVNDIDLLVATYAKGQWYWWTGNYYYDDPNACTRDGYSVRQTYGPGLRFDRGKNNVERINIKTGNIPLGATMLGVKVLAPGVVADGLFPDGSTPQQDFGLVVENAH